MSIISNVIRRVSVRDKLYSMQYYMYDLDC